MLRESGCFSDCAHRIAKLRREGSQTALEATSLEWNDDSCLAFETLCAAINHWSLSLRFRSAIPLELNHAVDHRVHPSPCLNVVQASNNQMELLIELL
jgi:hypothetical protein